MRVYASSFVIFVLGAAGASAEEFHPPQPYPAERYEAVWMKNPFTLKTAPAAVVKDSFAKDLAISSIFSTEDDTTVNIVNTKTHEQMRFLNKEEHHGIKVKKVNHSDSRSETSVELESGPDTAIVKYDDKYIASLSARNTPGLTKTGAGNLVLQPGAQNRMAPAPVPAGAPVNGMNNRPPNVPLPHVPGTSQPFNAPNVPTPPTRRVLTGPVSRMPLPTNR